MYFGTKSYLKSNRNHTAKHTPSISLLLLIMNVILNIFYLMLEILGEFKPVTCTVSTIY